MGRVQPYRHEPRRVPFLEQLIGRGVVEDPTPLMRPWRVREIVAVLAAADTGAMSAAERSTVGLLLREFAPSTGAVGYVFGLGGGVAVSTHQRRPQFSLRHTGDDRTTPELRGLLAIQFGNGLLMADGRYLEDLEDDPDYAGEVDRTQLTSDATYALYDSEYFDLELGSISRNWGPPIFPGLLVSDWPRNYDHLFLDVGPRRLHLSMVVTELDDAFNGSGRVAKRFFVAHRLAIQPTDWLDVAVWEGSVFSGANRNFELGFLNPLQASVISRNQRRVDSNVMLGGDVELRLGRFTLMGSFIGDDFDFGSGEPYSFAATVGAGAPLGPASVSLGYTMVSNLAYRTRNPADKPLIALDTTRARPGNGLGRNFADYDQTTLKVSVLPIAGLIVTPELTLLRQGEGDFRLPFPAVEDYDITPTFLAGTVERTWRAALEGTVHLPMGVTASFNGGIHRVVNAGNVEGASRTDYVGTVTLRYTLTFANQIR